MRLTMRLLMAGLVLLASAAFGAEGAGVPEWAAKLPANKWTQAEGEKGGGMRSGAAVAWLEKDRKFLVVCGVSGGAEGAPRVYEIQTFDPATGQWENIFPKGKEKEWAGENGNSNAPRFPGPSNQTAYLNFRDEKGNTRLEDETFVAGFSAFDAERRRLYICLAMHGISGLPKGMPIVRYNVEERTWEVVSGGMPPTKVPIDAGGARVEGVKLVLDPVNEELLFLGGRCPGAEGGSIGWWAFSPEKKEWRELTGNSASLDPLRGKCLAARRPAKDGEAAARNVFYAGLEAAAEAAAVKAEPARLLAEAARLAGEAAAAIGAAKADGWEQEAIDRARPLVDKAASRLKEAAAGLAAGKLDAALLKACFEGQWALDEAASMLASFPEDCERPAAGYDAASRCVVVFGGDHGDYVTNCTWIYDCSKKSWRQVFAPQAPAPRCGADLLWLPGRRKLAVVGGTAIGDRFVIQSRDNRPLADMWEFDAASGRWRAIGDVAWDQGKDAKPWRILSEMATGDGDVALGLAVKDLRYANGGMIRQRSAWLLRPGPAGAGGAGGAPPGTREYLSKVKAYDPCWYDEAPRGDAAAVRAWIDGLKPNEWIVVPPPPRLAPWRDWGTAVLDPEHDQSFHWTGGHQADCSSLVHVYHPGINRWSIPYVAEFFTGSNKGNTFNNRPDCNNHTYLNYTWDPASKRMVCLTTGGAAAYDPGRREFESSTPQLWGHDPYMVKALGTPKGTVCWTPGFFGLFDAKTRKFEKLPVTGKLPAIVHGDCNYIAYDHKRDVLWLGGTKDFNTGSGQMWRYDMKTGEVKEINPAGMEKAAAFSGRPRETVYLPEADMVLFKLFDPATRRQLAYDPEKNRWVLTSLLIPEDVRKNQGDLPGIGAGLIYDARRKMLWGIGHYKVNFALKLDFKALTLEDMK